MKSNVKCLCGVIAAVILIVGLLSPVYAQNANPRITSVQAPAVGGMTYSEWSARWWQWSVSLPVDLDVPENNLNPLMDYEYCANGANGQAGPVWFLTASFTGAVRTCNVPVGKFLFFPIINTECSTVEPDPWHGDNEQELRDCAMRFANADVFATIDDVDVTDLHQYFVISPVYNVTLHSRCAACRSVIRQWNNPMYAQGHLAILKGNLSTEGCVAKISGIKNPKITGPARVFESEETCMAAILARKIQAGDVVVIRS